MGIARGYTCYVIFSKPFPHEQPRKYIFLLGGTLGGRKCNISPWGPWGTQFLFLFFWVFPATLLYNPRIALHNFTVTYINLPYHILPIYPHSTFWIVLIYYTDIVFDSNVNVWTYLDMFRRFFLGMHQTPQECNIHFSGWEVGSCHFLFKPPKKCNIHFWGLSLHIWFLNLCTQPKNVM